MFLVGSDHSFAGLRLHTGIEFEIRTIGIGNNKDRRIGVPCGFDLFPTEFDQRSSRADCIAELDEVFKAVAVHCNGIDADVNQNFCAVREFHADGVFGSVHQHSDCAGDRSANGFV